MPKLIVQNTKTKEEQEYDLAKDSILLGRINTSDIELPQKSISRKHAEITRENSDYFLSDLRSGNGTKLNNKTLPPLEKSILRSGDVIRIEDYEIRFLITDEGQDMMEEDTDTDIIEIKLIKKMIKALDRDDTPSIEVLNGVSAGKRTPLPETKKEIILGRSETADIQIPENVLSREHAKLEKKWGGVVVTDLNSKNGTFVNNEPVHEKLLHDGDRVLLGTIKILFRNPKEVKAAIQHQELTRKKREAALQEAEKLAQKQLEAEEKAKEEEAARKAAEEEKAKEVEAALETEEEAESEEAAEEEAAEPEAASEAAESEASEEPPSPSREPEPLPPPGKPKLSGMEKILILLGVVVGLAAIIGVIMLLF